VVILQSGDAPNLKTALKKLIRNATNQGNGMEDDEVNTAKHGVSPLRYSSSDSSLTDQGRKLLNYDLQILHDHVKDHDFSKVVVAFQDSEAFESSLLAELIALFRSVWPNPVQSTITSEVC
jgi:origin recognition complex subunit 3